MGRMQAFTNTLDVGVSRNEALDAPSMLLLELDSNTEPS